MFSFNYSSDDFRESSSNWTEEKPELSVFDQELITRWDKGMEDGCFRYKLDLEKTKIIGQKQYVAQLNIKRSTERREPAKILSVNQPFNPNAFNFTKIKNEEILFQMAKVDKAESIGNEQQNGDMATSDKSEVEKNLVIINVSPMEHGHVLLVPDVNACRPQILTEAAIKLSIETQLLSYHRAFRIGFNSLCALASVNHQHLHAYYLPYQLLVETCPVDHLGGVLYEQTVLPVKGFAFQLHGTDVATLSRVLAKATGYFQENEIAYNLFMTRGTVFGEPPDSPIRTIRLFLWVRTKYLGTKDLSAFNVAFVELAGHLPIKVDELFDDLDEEQVETTMRKVNLDDSDYAKIKILTEAAIRLSIETQLLSYHRAFRIGFNSLCAFASVNHQHLHAYYLPYQLFVETCPVDHLCGVLYEQTAMPVKGFAFQLHGTDVTTLSRMVVKVTDYFQENEIAFNLFMTRGTVFGEPPDSPNRTIRLFLWVRTKYLGKKDHAAAFYVAFVELAGHLPIKRAELFDDLEEEDVEKTMGTANLDEAEYSKIKKDITCICSESL